TNMPPSITRPVSSARPIPKPMNPVFANQSPVLSTGFKAKPAPVNQHEPVFARFPSPQNQTELGPQKQGTDQSGTISGRGNMPVSPAQVVGNNVDKNVDKKLEDLKRKLGI